MADHRTLPLIVESGIQCTEYPAVGVVYEPTWARTPTCRDVPALGLHNYYVVSDTEFANLFRSETDVAVLVTHNLAARFHTSNIGGFVRTVYSGDP